MRIDVQRFGDRALLEYSPSLIERILFNRTAFDRYAVRVGGLWLDDKTGERIDEPQLERGS